MSLKATEVPITGGRSQEPLDPGTYPARIVGVALVGKHSQEFNGEVKEPKDVIYMFYEFLDEFLKDEDGNDIEDKPRWLSENFPFNNISSDKAKSTKRYMALDPTMEYEGDFAQLINKPCMVTVIQKAGKGSNLGKVYNNISSVSLMRPKEAGKAPDLINQPFVFDFYEPDEEVWKALPDWVKDQARKALNFEGSPMEDYKEVEKEEVKEEKKLTKKRVVPQVDNEKTLDDEIPW